MGSEISLISHYKIGQTIPIDSDLKVCMASATHIHDGQKYTTFQYEKENGKIPENTNRHLESLKIIRHPYILKYVTSFDSSRRHATLVTEHVIPLDVAVEKQEPEEIFSGLHNILEALIFLHDKALLCHNKVSVSSVFVSDDGIWKLGSFESSTKVLRLSKQSFENDIIGYKEFCLSVLEYLKDDAQNTKNFINRLETDFGDKENIGSLKSLLSDSFFKFPFLKTYHDLQNVTLKSAIEREIFYSTLAKHLQTFPPYAVSHRFAPLLFSHFVLTDPSADKCFLKHLFCADDSAVPNTYPIYGADNFKKYSLPFILSLFESRDAAIRLILLRYFSFYCYSIEKETLTDVVLPELVIGLKDSNDAIVAATFQALAALVPLLGGKTVVGGQFYKYFYDMKPDFTRNTDDSILTKSQVFLMPNSFEHLNSSSSMENSDDCIEKKKQQRLEREKQRENQKIKREQRRKLRHDKINQSTEIEGGETAKTEGNKNETASGNQSDPDWEGFEEFSSSGSDSREEDKRDPRTEDLTDNNWNWDNDNQKKNTKMNHLNSTDISSKSSHHNNALTPTSKLLLSNQLQPDSSFTELSLQLDSFHSPNIIENNVNIQTVQTKSEKNTFKKNTTTNNNSIKEKNLKKDLGSEFDIQVLNKLAEPDYFVDMVPNFKNEIKTVVIDINTVPTVSSKFAVTEILQDEPTAWDDDGWGSE
ncbi:protein-associating with the carboxyl-terminal domain of ezrin isoform X2 [Hydra vulgaris]|uniref:Protein-associating with the carboxyl-terminal domain of ezrin isoform X2 n=1 Tax=Hydra vulgaris TaxID=6087 RepID=A0ABM4BE73_HYDVU